MTPRVILNGLWAAFFVSWIAAALWAKRPVARMPRRARGPLYGVALAAALASFGVGRLIPGLRTRLWPANPWLDWGMVGISVLAFAWCWWARIHLGNLWSMGINRKEGHRIVDTGPYAIVRHPIYTGLITALLALEVVRARPSGFLLALCVIVFFNIKARLEERFLRQELGDAYGAYSERVPRLVPFGGV